MLPRSLILKGVLGVEAWMEPLGCDSRALSLGCRSRYAFGTLPSVAMTSGIMALLGRSTADGSRRAACAPSVLGRHGVEYVCGLPAAPEGPQRRYRRSGAVPDRHGIRQR